MRTRPLNFFMRKRSMPFAICQHPSRTKTLPPLPQVPLIRLALAERLSTQTHFSGGQEVRRQAPRTGGMVTGLDEIRQAPDERIMTMLDIDTIKQLEDLTANTLYAAEIAHFPQV